MGTDRGRSYDAQAFDDVKQQKCLAHILRSIREVLKTKKGRARDFGERLKALLQDAMQLWRIHPARWRTSPPGPTCRTRSPITCARGLTDPDNQRLLNGSAGTMTGAISCASWRTRALSRRTTGPSGPCVRP